MQEYEELKQKLTPGEIKARGKELLETRGQYVADYQTLRHEIEEENEELYASRLLKSMLILASFVFVFGYYFIHLKRVELAEDHKAVKVASFGRACLEGHFDLIQTANGEPFSSKDLIGKWALIYFGFTRCPDICPEQLEKLAYVIEAVDTGELT